MRCSEVLKAMVGLISLAFLFSSSAVAQTQQIPLVYEALEYDALKRFERIHEEGVFYPKIIELVPKGESKQNWTEMITIIMWDPDPVLTPEVAVNATRGQLEQVCPNMIAEISKTDLFPEDMYFLGCPNSLNAGIQPWFKKHELLALRSLKTRSALYVFQYAMHSDDDRLVTPEAIDAFRRRAVVALAKISLCDVSGEVACAADKDLSELPVVAALADEEICGGADASPCRKMALFTATPIDPTRPAQRDVMVHRVIKHGDYDLTDLQAAVTVATDIAQTLYSGAAGVQLMLVPDTPYGEVTAEDRVQAWSFFQAVRGVLINAEMPQVGTVDVSFYNYLGPDGTP